MLIVQHDFERRDAIVFQPRFLFIVLVVSRLNPDAIERKRTFHIERYTLADPITFDSLGPGRRNISGWIALYVNDLVIVFALGFQRRACSRIVITVVEKVLVAPNDVLSAVLELLFRITSRVRIIF